MRYAFLALCLSAAAAAQTNDPKNLQLFLLIGQSNMAGRGAVEAADREPIPNIFMFTEKMEWAPAVDPLHFDKPTIAGVGIGRSFAKTLADLAPGVSIGLIPAAFGGSALDEWGADGQHYTNALARARAAMKSGKLRGILWHQGEADSGKEELAHSYRDRFAKLAERLRKDLDAPEVPLVVGQLGPFYAGKFASVVNEQLATVALAIPYSGFVSSAGLEHKGDSVHFNRASLYEFGRRYALAYLALDPSWTASRPPAPKPATSKREITPDEKAYMSASGIKEPQKKIEALEKFKIEFPKSTYFNAADRLILNTLVKSQPGETARISRQAAAMYHRAPKQDKGRVANSVAWSMLPVTALLKEAESYARKGIASIHEADYVKEARANYAKRKETPPTEAELHQQFARDRAGRVDTLGEIYLKMGQDAQGRKLLEEALAANPDLPSASSALGQLALRQGRDADALRYLVAARLGGDTEPSTIEAFETVYRKTHAGTLDGVEAMLDVEYRKLFPNPVHVVAYQPAPQRSDRLVLAEVFTGAGCPPCAGADVAFDAAMERYSNKELIVLMYHQHIPRPDPMTNPDSVARAREYEVQGVPSFFVDGKKDGGGGPRQNAPSIYNRFNPNIEKDLASPAEAKVSVKASADTRTVSVRATAGGFPEDAKKLKLRMALVEKEVSYGGENGIRFHPMVVRATHDFAVKPGESASYDFSFDLSQVAAAALKNLTTLEANGFRGEDYHFKTKKHEVNPTGLAVAVWIEDADAGSRHVLQAAWADLSAPGVKTPTE